VVGLENDGITIKMLGRYVNVAGSKGVKRPEQSGAEILHVRELTLPPSLSLSLSTVEMTKHWELNGQACRRPRNYGAYGAHVKGPIPVRVVGAAYRRVRFNLVRFVHGELNGERAARTST